MCSPFYFSQTDIDNAVQKARAEAAKELALVRAERDGYLKQLQEDEVAKELAEFREAMEPFAEFGRYLLEHPRTGLSEEMYGWDNKVFLRQADVKRAALLLAAWPKAEGA